MTDHAPSRGSRDGELTLHTQSLTDLANHYGTDKGTKGPSPKWPAHNYTDVYEAYMYALRDEPIRLLEIGLGVTGDEWRADIVQGRNTGGASLRMWHDYFSRGTIDGIDINAAPYLDNDRITTYVTDSGDPDAMARYLQAAGDPTFDVVIDDGSHRPDHQQVSLGVLFPHVRSGGLYFIEDLHANGIGDKMKTRSAVDTVINTRRLLRGFLETEKFEEPHALIGQDYLAEHIGYLNFHVPRRKFKDNTESLCVIRKL